jgi:O-antigen/teichoic acid export membrane protein
MSLARALALNTGVQLIGKVVSTALGVVIVGLMTRHLGQEGFGAYSTANAFLQIFALLLDLGLNVTLIALLGEHAGDEKYERRCVSALYTLRIVMAVVVLGLFAPAIGFLMPYPVELKLAIVALLGSFFFPALNQVVTGVQQRHLKMHIAAIGEVMGRLVLLVGLLVARAEGWSLIPVVLFVSLGSLANFVFSFYATWRYSDFRWNWDPAFWRTALSRSWPIGVSIAFNLVYFKADTLILSFVRPQAEVGIYGAAYRVLEILITVPFMYAGVLLPILSKAWATRDRERFASLIGRSIDVMMLLISPLIVATWLLGTRVMAAVAGTDFIQSGPVLQILILAVGVIYLNTVLSHAVVAVDAQKKMLPVYIAVAALTLAGYVAFIPAYGIWAAAWLTVGSEFAVGLGSLAVTKNVSRLDFRIRTSAVSIAAAALMGLAIWLVRDQPLAVPLGIAAVTYAAAVYLLGGVPKEVLRDILSFRKEQTPIKPAV